jgi:acetyltransferase-like isoleucine patch superfamily enzyme
MIQNIIGTPWKALNEIRMLLEKPLVYIYLTLLGVSVGKSTKCYGFPKVYRHKGSTIEIGRRFENRNWWWSNPLGVNHPTIICTWEKGAEIIIGDNVGISGGSIVASKRIEIGDGTLIGANTTIIDTDFHPVKSVNRRYDKKNIKSEPIRVGKNVFIGMNCIILKGVKIEDNSVIPAGTILR